MSFMFMWPCIVTWPCIITNFFIIKPTRCTNFTNLFWHETLHVSDSSSVHHQEFIHCTLSNGPAQKLSTNLYDIPSLSVQWINCWWWTDELSEKCRVSWQNKFVKLVLLVGFIIKKNWWLCLSMIHLYRISRIKRLHGSLRKGSGATLCLPLI
jgi:hypothetical protein